MKQHNLLIYSLYRALTPLVTLVLAIYTFGVLLGSRGESLLSDNAVVTSIAPFLISGFILSNILYVLLLVSSVFMSTLIMVSGFSTIDEQIIYFTVVTVIAWSVYFLRADLKDHLFEVANRTKQINLRLK